eukprot:g161.t1
MSAKRTFPNSPMTTEASKKHRGELLTMEEVETQFAAAVGLPPYSLCEAELKLLPSDLDIERYLIIRNHILKRWRTNPKTHLKLESTHRLVRRQHLELAFCAWKFLDHYGYINFGVGTKMNGLLQFNRARKGTVIVIGAGLAGLAAARQLKSKGHRVIVLEGRDRIGGRVHSKILKMDTEKVVVELGGSVINGVEGNPLAVLAAQLCLPLHKISREAPLHFPDGTTVPKALDQESEELYNSLLDCCGRCREVLGSASRFISLGKALELAFNEIKMSYTPQHRMLVNWHFANLEFANANELELLSLRDWDQDDPHELPGEHVLLPGGNQQLINALADELDILLNNSVSKIQYSSKAVEVHTQDTIHKGDIVLVTVPLGVLKRNKIKFDPPLSDRKLQAIQSLGYGTLNKVVMWFPMCFWKNRGDVFGFINQNEKQRGRFFLFYSYVGISGGNVLVSLVSGQSAKVFETKREEVIIAEVMQVLANIFTPHGVHGRSLHIPTPIKVCCTSWGQDPFSYGSYSSVSMGCNGGKNYDIMAENIAKRVFFAGEATSRKYPATMHGAFLTGLREAANISNALNQI